MKSPFTGGRVTLHNEPATLVYRKEEFRYINSYYVCVDTGTPFTAGGMDNANLTQVYNQYRVRYSIPFADEIRLLRESYGLSALKMSTVLGFGDNQYRLYESGEMPSLSNGRLLKSIMDAHTFRKFVEYARVQLSQKEYNTIVQNIEDRDNAPSDSDYANRLIFNGLSRGAENGYARMSVDRLRNIMLFFIEHCENVFNTKMNKLLFYLDMLSYRESGFAMTGLAYKAVKFGPVPVRWDRIYSMVDGISQEIVDFDSGVQGFRLVADGKFTPDGFSENEIGWMQQVADRFYDTGSSAISQISHQEKAWQNAFNENRLVNFDDAFSLQSI